MSRFRGLFVFQSLTAFHRLLARCFLDLPFVTCVYLLLLPRCLLLLLRVLVLQVLLPLLRWHFCTPLFESQLLAGTSGSSHVI